MTNSCVCIKCVECQFVDDKNVMFHKIWYGFSVLCTATTKCSNDIDGERCHQNKWNIKRNCYEMCMCVFVIKFCCTNKLTFSIWIAQKI